MWNGEPWSHALSNGSKLSLLPDMCMFHSFQLPSSLSEMSEVKFTAFGWTDLRPSTHLATQSHSKYTSLTTLKGRCHHLPSALSHLLLLPTLTLCCGHREGVPTRYLVNVLMDDGLHELRPSGILHGVPQLPKGVRTTCQAPTPRCEQTDT